MYIRKWTLVKVSRTRQTHILEMLELAGRVIALAAGAFEGA